MGPLITILSMLFVVTSVALILVILIQRPQGGGLSAAFGGGAGSQSAFGAKTGDVLTIVTVGTFIAFLLIAIGLVLAVESAFGPQNVGLPPLPPEQVTAAPAGPGKVTITWDDLEDEDVYVVQRSATGEAPWTDVGELEQDVTTFTDFDLAGETEYFYRVVAANAGGAEVSEVVSATTEPTPVEEEAAAPGVEDEEAAPTPTPGEATESEETTRPVESGDPTADDESGGEDGVAAPPGDDPTSGGGNADEPEQSGGGR